MVITVKDGEKLDGGKLEYAVVTARMWDGFTVTTADGDPAVFAILDEAGRVVESGPYLARHLWEIAVLSYRCYLIREKALKVWSEPSGRFEERGDP